MYEKALRKRSSYLVLSAFETGENSSDVKGREELHVISG
jgi:hypothetical protein